MVAVLNFDFLSKWNWACHCQPMNHEIVPSHESFKTGTCNFFLILKNVRYCGKIGPKKCQF